ncbi:hypothetical protein [Nitrospirillum pindoramense]|uniref:Uncharacterized protein n=1 Tax=Nitrospirillum amazonense TaxID=28077 RepID=A0A560H803_9PROT|nr:hypothetical protein [Nitrospirillum amazonense]TWB42438.1 hypothetical protein FBZ90_10632 [Nitrospirillum amazonense]
MTPEELDDLLCQYGAQLRAWPVEQQRAVTAFLLSSSEGRARVREMRRLERLVVQDVPVEPPPGMMERVERRLVAAALKDWSPPPSGTAPARPAAVFFKPGPASSAQPISSAAANSDTEPAPSARGRRQVPEPHRD